MLLDSIFFIVSIVAVIISKKSEIKATAIFTVVGVVYVAFLFGQFRSYGFVQKIIVFALLVIIDVLLIFGFSATSSADVKRIMQELENDNNNPE